MIPDPHCGIAGQNMVPAAHGIGLETCRVSFAGPAFRDTDTRMRFFRIEPPSEFLGSIAVGWPGGKPTGEAGRPRFAVEWYEDDGGKKAD